MPGTGGLSGVGLPKERLSGSQGDGQEQTLTLSVSWKSGGLGDEKPQVPLTLPSTLCQSTATLLGRTATRVQGDAAGRGHLHGQTHNTESPAWLKMAATSR